MIKSISKLSFSVLSLLLISGSHLEGGEQSILGKAAYGTGKIHPFRGYPITDRFRVPGKDDLVLMAYRFLELNPDHFQIKNPRKQYVLKEIKTDSVTTIVTFQQMSNGVPVEAWGRFYFNQTAELQRVYLTYYEISNLSTSAKVSSAAAVKIALGELNFPKGARLDGPVGREIIWAGKLYPEGSDKFYLVWRLKVFPQDSEDQTFYWNYVINALDGEILSKSPGRINCYSFQKPFLPGELIQPLWSTDLSETAYTLFELNPEHFHMKNPRKDLVLKTASWGEGGPRVSFIQVHNGIEILNSGLSLFGAGLNGISGTYFSDINLSTTPRIDSAAAENLAFKDLDFPRDDKVVTNENRSTLLSIWRSDEGKFHLIWIVHINQQGPHRSWRYFIDAHDGSILYKRDEIIRN